MAAREVAIALLTGLAICVFTGDVHAQKSDPAELTKAQREELGRLFNRAKSAYESDNFHEAIGALERAYAIFPEPNILYRIGDAYENLGELEPAIEYYRRYVSEAPDATDRGLVRRRIQDLERRLQALRDSVDEEPTEQAAFLIDTNPAGASVRIDGEPAASTTPVRLEVEPGPHAITLELADYVPLTRDVVIEAGETLSLIYQLQEVEKPAPPPEEGPGALPWVVTGAGVAALGTSTGLLVGAFSASNQVARWDAEREAAYDRGETPPPRPENYDTLKRRSVLWRNSGFIVGSVGLLMVAGGVTWLMVAPRPGDGAEVAVRFRF